MVEITLRGKKYNGIFNGDKRKKRDPGCYVDEWWYEGAALIQYKSNNKRYFFRFFISQKFSKPSLKGSLESLCLCSKGFDSLCKSIISERKKSKEQVPEIVLPITN